MVYTIEQLKTLITPVALKYKLPAVYLFVSYAKGEATEDSDVDILVDKTGTALKGIKRKNTVDSRKLEQRKGENIWIKAI